MRILFVDPDHGPRSQMAAALLGAAAAGRAEVTSAGTDPAGRVEGVGGILAESGIVNFVPAHTALSDIPAPPDLLIAVCEDGCAACPYLPGSREVRRWPFPDPGSVDPAGRVHLLRTIRDQLVPLVRDLVEELLRSGPMQLGEVREPD